jgi:phosphoribosylformylglycinamidine cyclo-ligase
MHAAVGDANWFALGTRGRDLADGFAEGCRQAQAVWGGGETPALRGIVGPEAIVLAGSALGRIQPKTLRITGEVRPGDAIIFLASSGVQTNGLTLCRRIAESLPQGYLTPLQGVGDPRPFGEVLLDPSVIYVRFVHACQQAGLPLHYVAHVTGHGWRKLMRLEEPLVYRITQPRPALPIFRFLMQAGPVELREAYATFNMGVGFAAYVAPGDADRCVSLARAAGYDAWIAGSVVKDGSRKAVEVPSLGLSFEAESLQLR